jgi:hypothetical protein
MHSLGEVAGRGLTWYNVSPDTPDTSRSGRDLRRITEVATSFRLLSTTCTGCWGRTDELHTVVAVEDRVDGALRSGERDCTRVVARSGRDNT